jgi:hypothetical protein
LLFGSVFRAAPNWLDHVTQRSAQFPAHLVEDRPFDPPESVAAALNAIEERLLATIEMLTLVTEHQNRQDQQGRGDD